MMLLERLAKSMRSNLEDSNRPPPTMEETAREASQQFHSKQTKLSTALEAILTQDLSRIADREQRTAEAYTRRTVFGDKHAMPAGEGESMAGDVIVADNIAIDNRRSAGAWRSIVAIMLTLGALVLAGLLLTKVFAEKAVAQPITQTQTVKHPTWKYVIDIWTDETGKVQRGVRSPDEPPLWEKQ